MFLREDPGPAPGGRAGDDGTLLPLSEQLAMARAELATLQPPSSSLTSLLAAFDAAQALRPARSVEPEAGVHDTTSPAVRWRDRLAALIRSSGRVIAAALSLPRGLTVPWTRWTAFGTLISTACVALVIWQGALLHTVPGATRAQHDAGFFLLVPSTELAHNPAAWLVQTEMPQASLALLGAPFDPTRAAEPVRTEMLVNARGDVLAVRWPR